MLKLRVHGATSSLVTSVNVATCGVALAAGIAGMLAVETRASAAVGVGLPRGAAGEREANEVTGALAMLGVNVGLLLLGGMATLLVQRRLARP